MHKERLLKLATFLENLDPRVFDYSTIRVQYEDGRECGTLACAVGWLPECFPDLAAAIVQPPSGHPFCRTVLVAGKGDYSVYQGLDLAELLFGTNREETDYLFLPATVVNSLLPDATPRSVAALIRTFVEADADIERAKSLFQAHQKAVAGCV